MHHGQRQRGVGARAHQDYLVGERPSLGSPNVDRHDPRTPSLGGIQMRGRIGLADCVRTPKHDHLRMRAHVFLGRGLERAGEPHAEPAEPPADHRRVPMLAAVEIGEPVHLLALHASAIIVRRIAVALPETHRLSPHAAHVPGDQVQGLVPAGIAPAVRAASLADQRRQKPGGIADDLVRGLTPHAEPAAAIGVALVAGDRNQFPAIDLDLHPAERGMTVHWTHRFQHSRSRHGRSPYPCKP